MALWWNGKRNKKSLGNLCSIVNGCVRDRFVIWAGVGLDELIPVFLHVIREKSSLLVAISTINGTAMRVY